MRQASILVLALLLTGAPSFGGEADIEAVEVSKQGIDYRFDVTVRHTDTGWDHYANRWELLAPDSKILATRTLHHPHVDEQPFTRSLSGVKIPEGITRVSVRAHDSVHAYGGKTTEVVLP